MARPTSFAVGAKPGQDAYLVTVTNTGGAPADGETSPIVITDELPAGLAPAPGATGEDELGVKLNTAGHNFSKDCEVAGEEQRVSCTYGGVVQPGDTLLLRFPVQVASTEELKKLEEEREKEGLPPTTCPLTVTALSCVTNAVRVAGGGAPGAAMPTPTDIYAGELQASEATPFGLSPGGATTALSSVQAGAHPDLTVSAAFDTLTAAGATAGNVKDTTYDLPAGFAADLVDTPACQAVLFLRGECPTPTQIGVTTITLDPEGPSLDLVYNLAPEPGEVAKLGFGQGATVYEGDISVRPPGAPGEPYGARTTFYNVTAGGVELDDVSLTIWGVPASPLHDPLRFISEGIGGVGGHFGGSSGAVEAAYFTNATSCGAEPLQARFTLTSWQHPNESESPAPTVMPFGPIVGCDALVMEPSLTAEVTSNAAYSPTGFDLDTSIPQTYPNPILATPTLQQEVVTLPEGMTVNPSSGAGLQACSEAQFAEEAAPAKTAKEKEEGHGCPNASKLATVRIKTPSISEEVTGSAYLAEPAPRGEAGKNPFNTLLSLYLVARAADRGVLVKAPGKVELNPQTGRITTTFGPTPEFDGMPATPGLPPLPANDIKFEFNQGANAPLVTPPTCGSYTVMAEMTPWSNPEGSPLTPAIPPFPISTSCPSGGVPPFAPQVTAGTLNNAAGAYSPLDIKLSRNDGEQEITGFSSQMPPGLTANLTGVQQCSEAQVQAAKSQTGAEAESSPACPAGSEIGHSIAEAGVGSVLAQAPGKIYLGAPYQGAPFSIVSVTAAKVGPFDLGTVVVHLPLFLNPETAAVTVGSGSSNQIPHIIKGIVIHVRNIRVYVDRSNFTQNPTSCAPMAFGATIIGGGADPTNPADNTPATVNDPFQAADCANLSFKPKFSASTESKDSFNNQGASLKVNLAANQGPNASTGQGVESNIAKVKVELPGALPSRLTTLQKACTAAQFNLNPSGCPAASNIGVYCMNRGLCALGW